MRRLRRRAVRRGVLERRRCLLLRCGVVVVLLLEERADFRVFELGLVLHVAVDEIDDDRPLALRVCRLRTAMCGCVGVLHRNRDQQLRLSDRNFGPFIKTRGPRNF